MSWQTPDTYTVGEVLTSTSMNKIGGDLAYLHDTLNVTQITPSISADQNNWAPTGLSTATWIYTNTTGALNITGIAAQSLGRVLALFNNGISNLTLKHQSASSSSGNKFFLPSTADFVIPPYGTAWLFYDGTSWIAK